MDLKRLLAPSFDKNVGPTDRVLGLVSGAALALAGFALHAPTWARAALVVFGLMWTLTGVLSRCTIYYALGRSTCPADASRHTAAAGAPTART